MTNPTFTATEQARILADANDIDQQLIAIQQHLLATGTVVPMRTLGFWEEMVLDQRDLIFQELKQARALATQWGCDD